MVIIFINYSFRWARATTAGDFLNADNAHYSAMIFPVSSKASVLASRNSYKHSPFDRFFRSMVYELVTAEYCCKIFPSKDKIVSRVGYGYSKDKVALSENGFGKTLVLSCVRLFLILLITFTFIKSLPMV